MKNKLEDFIEQNSQVDYPLFFRNMTVRNKVKGKSSYYSEKHKGFRQSHEYYKQISWINNNEGSNE